MKIARIKNYGSATCRKLREDGNADNCDQIRRLV